MFCSRCQRYVKAEPDYQIGICPECLKKTFSRSEIFRTLKYLALVFAGSGVAIFIACLLAEETSPGYYTIPGGKGRPISHSENELVTIKLLCGAIAIIFSGLSFWFSKKQRESVAAESEESTAESKRSK